MSETLTMKTATAIDLGDPSGLGPVRQPMLCESVSLLVKIVGTTALASVALGVTGDLAVALFAGVGYSTALVCTAVLPIDRIRTPKVPSRSRAVHR